MFLKVQREVLIQVRLKHNPIAYIHQVHIDLRSQMDLRLFSEQDMNFLASVQVRTASTRVETVTTFVSGTKISGVLCSKYGTIPKQPRFMHLRGRWLPLKAVNHTATWDQKGTEITDKVTIIIVTQHNGNGKYCRVEQLKGRSTKDERRAGVKGPYLNFMIIA